MLSLTKQQIQTFQSEILTWYDTHQRVLPWRKTRDPYHILVSEVMLQQTQVNRVTPKFEAWLEAFPTVSHLAQAPVSEVLQLWSGLGYNRRALNLKKTALIVSEKYKGAFPRIEKELLALPGIGAYTARAILCFAFNKQVAVVDTNVRKVILTKLLNDKQGIRLADASAAITSLKDKEITTIAEQILPPGKAYEWNQALMDYANLMLKKEKITIPKQSKFHGSHRYYRGQILKALLKQSAIPAKELGPMIKPDFNASETNWLNALLEELVNEGFITKEKSIVTLTR